LIGSYEAFNTSTGACSAWPLPSRWVASRCIPTTAGTGPWLLSIEPFIELFHFPAIHFVPDCDTDRAIRAYPVGPRLCSSRSRDCVRSMPFTSSLSVRATVATNALDAPARRKTRAHGWQTGRREMLTRGVPQRRQSDGKRVAKRLSATPLTDETRVDTSELSRVKTWVPVARIGSSLLLKTSLPRPPVSARGPPQANSFLSIAGDNVPSNDSTIRRPRPVSSWVPALGELSRMWIGTTA